MRPILSSLLLAALPLAAQAHTVPEASLAPSVDPGVGYRLQDLGGGVHAVIDTSSYVAMFAVTDAGVVVFDVPPTMAEAMPAAVAAVTDRPVTHVIYSHAHTDHIGGAGAFAAAEIVAHEDAARLIPFIDGDKPPAPTRTFAGERLEMEVGGLEIVLEQLGPGHDPGNLFITLPAQRVLMAVDIIEAGHVPWNALNYASHIPGYLAQVEAIMARDFDHFVGGHVDQVTGKDALRPSRDYVFAVRDAMRAGFAAVDPAAFLTLPPGQYATVDTTAEFRAFLDAVVDRCEAEVIPSWKDRLGAVEAFARSHCEAFFQEKIDSSRSIFDE